MKAKCPKCNYEWETNSKLDYVTCPNCQKKFEKSPANMKKTNKINKGKTK